jgi:uncharacterized membrane protein
MHPLLKPLLLLLLSLSFMYVWAARMFKKDFVVEINRRRIPHGICSVVFFFWALGMAMSFHALSFIPPIIKLLLASA